MNKIIIDDQNSGQRFDKYLIRMFRLGGKGFVYKMLRKKRIKLNGSRAEGSEILKAGDEVTLYIAPETTEALSGRKEISSAPPLDIIFEDENVIICNKPSGMLTHPGLTDAAAYHVKTKSPSHNPAFSPVAVNRLDRNTSGIVVIAKTLHAAQELSKAFRERTVEKYYTAVVPGKIPCAMTLEGAHSKDRSKNTVTISSAPQPDTKTALTELHPVYYGDGYTVLRIKLETGLTHQIRAHLQSIGHGIIGDPKYGDPSVNKRFAHGGNGQLLHASEIVLNGLGGRLEYLRGARFVSKPDWGDGQCQQVKD